MLLLLLLAAARAQIEPSQEDGIDVLTTPMHGEACGYASCLPVIPGWLNVHIVPQTHSELGHGYNFHQHFTGEDPPLPKNTINMKRILDAILTELWSDSNRRFTLSDTAYLFHWWKNRHPAVHRMMYQLVRSGRLTIVGGGLGVSDEASTNYHAIIDQFTYSLRKLNSTFRACARPLVAWAADVYGHSREFTSLMAQMGYDALFINPISYDEQVARMGRKSMEFLWRGSDDLGAYSDMFTHNLFDGYWAPPGFCFSKLCSDPLLVTSSHLFSDIQDRADKFIETVLYRQAPNFETRNVMVIMGHRKAYSDAKVWFTNIDKLIGYTNWRANQKQLNITLFYSNPPCYLAAVHDENPELETKQDDFFPYVHDKDSYTVGMYTSRPTFKYIIREAHVYLQIAKQMQVTANMGPYADIFDNFNWVMGVVQDHSVASGVIRDRVKQYYTERIDEAITKSLEFVSKAFTKLRSSPQHVSYFKCQFNISSCFDSRFIKYSIQVYNPLGWAVTTPVRLPIYPTNSVFKVYDKDGEEVKSATIKLPDTILNINDRADADYELVFIASNIPPVGFRSYYIEAHFHKASVLVRRHGGKSRDYDDDEDKTFTPKWKQKAKSRTNKHKTKGTKANKREKKMITTNTEYVNNTQNITSNNLEDLKDSVSNYMKDRYLVDDIDNDEIYSTTEGETLLPMLKELTTESAVMLPMLRDFLQKSKVFRKVDFAEKEKALLSSYDSFESKYPSTETQFESTHTTEADIKIPFKKSFTRFSDIVVPDIKVNINRPIKGPIIQKPLQLKSIDPYRPLTSTTEPDIRVFTPVKKSSDIKIVVDTGKKISSNKSIIKSKAKEQESVEFDQARTEADKPEDLAIVPVQAASSKRTGGWIQWFSTTESVLVVPVRKMWEMVTSKPKLKGEMERQDVEVKSNEDIHIQEHTTESVNVPVEIEIRQKNKTHVFNLDVNRNSESIIDTDVVVETGAQNEDIEHIENLERFRIYSQTTEEPNLPATGEIAPYEEVESSTGEETTDFTTEKIDYTYSSPRNIRYTDDDKTLYVSPIRTKSNTFDTSTVDSNEKYFKVDDGSRLFIGNKYVRVNLNEKRRVSSIFLRNGVRMNLEILMFHYVSDDPSKFDIRTSPRRDIKPPGAYIFRPIDPYIVRSENNYDVDIVKTDIVEEMRITYSNWTSLQLRLYVDSPVIELHWLVGPIPTEDGLGKDVFIRYKTDLDHDGAFYTDSNGRQTIKRIRGARATYNPVEMDPITGNLYPVTSRIHIEDLNKNIRFSVYNDRCQAGGALLDGAIDLMLHRRILTDDIGFGAYLNETEYDEPIRAIGTHYLYLSKAHRNKIFEKKLVKEINFAPRVLTSSHLMYSDDLRKQFYDSKNEFSALKEKLPLGIHLLSLERITADEMLVRFENYLETGDATSDGVRYVRLRDLFKDIKVVWLKETLLAGNIYKEQWRPTQWRKKNKFYRRFNEHYGSINQSFEEERLEVPDELGGRGVRLAPQQIRTFIVKYKYTRG